MENGKLERCRNEKMKNGKVYYDFRDNILVDKNSPILAFKANRDRYSPKGSTKAYGGMPMLGSIYSEDALTWNTFMSLQKAGRLQMLNEIFGEDLTDARLLLWTYAVSDDDESGKLQYLVGETIRQIDGRRDRKQITEPDVILVTEKSFILCEVKLGEPGKCRHLWSNSKDDNGEYSSGPDIRYNDYFVNNANPFKEGITKDDEIYSKYAYQLFRMAFYAYRIAANLNLEPKLISLTNETWWNLKKQAPEEVPSETWNKFCAMIDRGKIFMKNIFWQDIWLTVNGMDPDKVRGILSSGRPYVPTSV